MIASNLRDWFGYTFEEKKRDENKDYYGWIVITLIYKKMMIETCIFIIIQNARPIKGNNIEDKKYSLKEKNKQLWFFMFKYFTISPKDEQRNQSRILITDNTEKWKKEKE